MALISLLTVFYCILIVINKSITKRGCETTSSNGRLKGLSCLKGNFLEQFLGEGVMVTSPFYPAEAPKGAGLNLVTLSRSER